MLSGPKWYSESGIHYFPQPLTHLWPHSWACTGPGMTITALPLPQRSWFLPLKRELRGTLTIRLPFYAPMKAQKSSLIFSIYSFIDETITVCFIWPFSVLTTAQTQSIQNQLNISKVASPLLTVIASAIIPYPRLKPESSLTQNIIVLKKKKGKERKEKKRKKEEKGKKRSFSSFFPITNLHSDTMSLSFLKTCLIYVTSCLFPWTHSKALDLAPTSEPLSFQQLLSPLSPYRLPAPDKCFYWLFKFIILSLKNFYWCP